MGDVDFYLEQRKVEDFRAIEKKQTVVAEKEKPKATTSFQDQKKIKSLKNQLSSVESKIGSLEKEIKEIDHNLLVDYDATIAEPNFFDGYQAKKKKLETLMQKWETLTIDIEELT